MINKTELLPCPICGKKVSIARADNEVGERWWFITRGTYRTTRCNCRLFLESEKFTCGWNDDYSLECRAKLIDKWNTRAPVEYDGWFYLPKPKENIVQYGAQRTEQIEHGYKVTQSVEVIESAIRSWGDELGEYIMKRICEAWNTRSTYNALTAEQVREYVQHVYYEGYNDGSVHRAHGIEETDWQAIADELNAELGSETCENEWAVFGKFRCSKCWLQIDSISTNTTAPIPIKHCPNCGAKVVKR